MSRRAILNITSDKKQDNMMSATVSGGVINIAELNLTASNTVVGTLFSPTQRVSSQNAIGSFDPRADRNSSDTFAKGYKESVRIAIGGNSGWMWRRIVFETKSDPVTGPVSPFNAASATSSVTGYVRLVNQLTTTGMAACTQLLLKGDIGFDWHNPFEAKVDNERVKIHSDRVFTINNPTGFTTANQRFVKNYKFYNGLNKTLIYNDEESGKSELPQNWASSNRRSMGDLYVFDMFFCVAGASDVDARLTFTPQGTYYWHEK